MREYLLVTYVKDGGAGQQLKNKKNRLNGAVILSSLVKIKLKPRIVKAYTVKGGLYAEPKAKPRKKDMVDHLLRTGVNCASVLRALPMAFGVMRVGYKQRAIELQHEQFMLKNKADQLRLKK